MSITDELCESSAGEIFFNLHKEERMTPNICLELEPRRNSEIPKISKLPWQIADKFRQCLIAKNLQSSTIVEFLDTLLTHIKKGPIASHEFTRSICTYLFATKYLVKASKLTLDKAYYDHVRKILVLYCILELSMINCFDDDSTLASDILIKISLLMQGSNVVTVMDVLIDIDEEIRSIRSIRSSAIMKIVHRKYLTRSLAGPVELNDTNFIKHLILFHLWYKAENITERPYVLKVFLSTIKPSRQLRSNPMFAPYLHSYNDDEVDDYKKLIQQPFDQKSLVIALRQVEMNTDCHHGFQENIFLDLTGETIVKSEVEVTLNLPGEVINVDDDDDEVEINYLSTLYRRLSDRCEGENKILLRNNVPVEIVDIDSDSDVELIVEHPKSNSSTNENNDLQQAGTALNDCLDDTVCEHDSPDAYLLSKLTSDNIRPCGSLNVKTYSRISTVQGLISERRLKFRRNSLSLNRTYLKQNVKSFPPILRSRSFTTTTKGKKVTFQDPPVSSRHVFIRNDYNESTVNSLIIPPPTQTSNSIEESPSHSDSSSGYIVTGPQCNYPYVSASAVRCTPPISLSQDHIVQHLSSQLKRSKPKKRRGHKRYSKPRTSIENWMKRKKIDINTASERTESNEAINSESLNNPLLTQHATTKICSIRLTRCDTELLKKHMTRVSVDLIPLTAGPNDLRKLMKSSEDMPLKIMGVKEQTQTIKPMQVDSEQESISVQLCVARNDIESIELLRENRDTSVVKTKKSRSLSNISKSKSVIKSTKRTSVNTKRKSSAKKCSSTVRESIAANASPIMYSESQIRDCYILLEKMPNHVARSTSNSSQKSQKLSCNPITNSSNNNESICRLPTKSPQEYQFKRSFEKLPANEVTLMSQAKEISCDATVDRISEPLVSNNQLKQPLQSLPTVYNRTPTTTQFVENEDPFVVTLGSELTNQSLNTFEIEASTQSTEVPDQTSDAQSSASKLIEYETSTTNETSVTSTQQLNRSATNYSPDTTTTSMPQYSSNSGTNSPCNEMITGITTTAHNPMNMGKQMLYDDCDIPSPAYSPYVGKRKIGAKQKSSILQITKLHQYKCDGDLITPIDLSKGNDANISMVTTVNGDDVSNRIDDVDSTRFNHDRNDSPDAGHSLIGEVLSSRRGDESSAMFETTNDRISSELNSPSDNLPESSSLSTSNTVDNLKKPKIYIKSGEQLYHNGV